jgi:pyruvate/2-oxoglutarate dehydrogenase complex dihydrolipoamide dehydrogenase (E3) component
MARQKRKFSMEHYDAIILGAGQGGDPLARAWAAAGRKVALIEKAYVGGTCVNTGCTPTKAMVASARIAYLTRRAAEFGVSVDSKVTMDMHAVRDRAQGIVQDFRQGTAKSLQSKGVDVIYGKAKFTGLKTLEVRLNDTGIAKTIEADQIFIDVGTRPAKPSISGIDSIEYLSNASIEQLEETPTHLVIIGGGYIALEFGQMFRRFGSRVTIIQQGKQLLDREDTDVAEEMANILIEDGITVLLEAQVVQIESDNEPHILVKFKQADAEQTLTGSHLLVAVGRTPNTEDLGLDAAGVETDDHGFVKTNERLETTASGVYALGDCKGGPQFTHVSYDDFRVLCARLLDHKDVTIKDRLVPYTVFTDPQLGRVGLTETEARQAGRKVAVAKLPMTEVARAIETSETRGFMKAIVDTEDGQILGCAMLGVNGGEVMAVVQVAMMGKLPYTVLRDAVIAHPTLSESLNNLFMTLDPSQIQTPDPAPSSPTAGKLRGQM